MDIITQRFIAIGNRIITELRGLHVDFQQLISTIRNQEERNWQEQAGQQPPPQILRAELQIPEDAQRQQRTSAKRHFWVQVWIAITSTLAFIAAAIYAGFAYSQSKEMSHQVETSISTSRAQLRAYLMYDGGKVVISPDGRTYTAYVSIKNVGQTPSYNTTHWINGVAVNQPEEPLAVAWNHGIRDTGRQTIDIGSQQSMCISQQFPMDAKSDAGIIYVWGIVKYRDRYQRCQLEMFEVRTTGEIKNGQSLNLAVSFNEATDYNGDRWDDPKWDKCREYTPGRRDFRMPLSYALGTEELPADPQAKSVVFQGKGCPPER